MPVTAAHRQEAKRREMAIVLEALRVRPVASYEFVAIGVANYKLRLSQLKREQDLDIRSVRLCDGGRRYSLWGRKGSRSQLPLFGEGSKNAD